MLIKCGWIVSYPLEHVSTALRQSWRGLLPPGREIEGASDKRIQTSTKHIPPGNKSSLNSCKTTTRVGIQHKAAFRGPFTGMTSHIEGLVAPGGRTRLMWDSPVALHTSTKAVNTLPVRLDTGRQMSDSWLSELMKSDNWSFLSHIKGNPSSIWGFS